MGKHTPGPWKWGPDWGEVNGKPDGFDEGYDAGVPKYGDLRLVGRDGSVILPIRLDHYRVIWDQYPIHLSEADAHLIASAPELLADLKEAAELVSFLAMHLRGRMGEDALIDMELKAKSWWETIAKTKREGVSHVGRR